MWSTQIISSPLSFLSCSVQEGVSSGSEGTRFRSETIRVGFSWDITGNAIHPLHSRATQSRSTRRRRPRGGNLFTPSPRRFQSISRLFLFALGHMRGTLFCFDARGRTTARRLRCLPPLLQEPIHLSLSLSFSLFSLDLPSPLCLSLSHTHLHSFAPLDSSRILCSR